MPSNPPTFPTLRQLYAWSTAQPETRRSGGTARSCPLALYWRDEGRQLRVHMKSVSTLDFLATWFLPTTLRHFVRAHDRVIEDAMDSDVHDDTLTPRHVRRIIETLEREAMLTALEECHAH